MIAQFSEKGPRSRELFYSSMKDGGNSSADILKTQMQEVDLRTKENMKIQLSRDRLLNPDSMNALMRHQRVSQQKIQGLLPKKGVRVIPPSPDDSNLDGYMNSFKFLI